MSRINLVSSLLALVALSLTPACVTEHADDASDWPVDPGGTAPTPRLNNVTPAVSLSRAPEGGAVIRISLLGLLDPSSGKPIPFRANETVYVAEDGVLKGLKVAQAKAENRLPVDIAFLVDNSGSMDEEADGVADKIVAFANVLTQSGVDAKLAVVGYGGSGEVNGAADFDGAAGVEAYLKRQGLKGTSRTMGFEGTKAETLRTKADAQGDPSGENGISGLMFAEANLSFRPGAARVFVNFTDEPTQPGNKAPWMTKTICNGWTPTRGTIHTVWSGSQSLETTPATRWTEGDDENPADLSRCTPGGIVKNVKADATDLDLTTLPLTSALANSALVEFRSKDATAPHDVVVTVKSGDTADGRVELRGVRY